MFNPLAPWLTETEILPTTVGAQPLAVTPMSADDLILGWQGGQTPSTRAFQVQELMSSPAIGGPFLPLTGGTVTGPVIFEGPVTIDALNATLKLINLPTSDAGLTTGDVWNNGNFLCVVP